jgi:hypothetical protein
MLATDVPSASPALDPSCQPVRPSCRHQDLARRAAPDAEQEHAPRTLHPRPCTQASPTPTAAPSAPRQPDARTRAASLPDRAMRTEAPRRDRSLLRRNEASRRPFLPLPILHFLLAVNVGNAPLMALVMAAVSLLSVAPSPYKIRRAPLSSPSPVQAFPHRYLARAYSSFAGARAPSSAPDPSHLAPSSLSQCSTSRRPRLRRFAGPSTPLGGVRHRAHS